MPGYPFRLEKLINEISKLPGIGPRMAERIALSIAKKGVSAINPLSESLQGVLDLKFCSLCHNISDENICDICHNRKGKNGIICVVESPEDVITIERTGTHKGTYHVLHGLINPLNNILPENLKIKELIERAQQEQASELMLALNHTVEGDATSLYISRGLKERGLNVRLTRLAKGLPTGSDIRYADELTLSQAISERKDF